MLRNRDKLQPDGPLGPNASVFLCKIFGCHLEFLKQCLKVWERKEFQSTKVEGSRGRKRWGRKKERQSKYINYNSPR